MKKIILVFFLYIFSKNELFSQAKKNIIVKSSLINYYLTEGFNLAVERSKLEIKSDLIMFQFGDWDTIDKSNKKNKYYSLIYQHRKYFHSKNRLSGLFINPYYKYKYQDIFHEYSNSFWGLGEQKEEKFKAHSLNIGGMVGYQNFIFDKFVYEIYQGGGLGVIISSKGKTKPSRIQPDGIIGFSIGYKF